MMVILIQIYPTSGNLVLIRLISKLNNVMMYIHDGGNRS